MAYYTHTHVQKPSSFWTPAAPQSQSLFGPRPFPDLTKSKVKSAPKEIRPYSREAADRLHANVRRTLQAKAEEEARANALAERGEEELDSSPAPELEQGGSLTTVQKAPQMTVQRLCSECEKERQGQQEEEEQSSSRGLIQPKLTIGEPGDPYEQEADRVAKQVVSRMKAPEIPTFPVEPGKTLQSQGMISVLQRLRESEKQIQLQHERTMLQRITRPAVKPSVPNVQGDFETRLNRARGGGSPLDNTFRAKVEPAIGADFSGVKVHTDAEADQLNRSIQAKAFTTGRDIFFRQGEYNPGSKQGQELLAHELTHVVQQSSNIGHTGIQRTEFGNEVRFDSLPGSPLRARVLGSVPDEDIALELYGNPAIPIAHVQDISSEEDVIEVDYEQLLPRWQSYFEREQVGVENAPETPPNYGERDNSAMERYLEGQVRALQRLEPQLTRTTIPSSPQQREELTNQLKDLVRLKALSIMAEHRNKIESAHERYTSAGHISPGEGGMTSQVEMLSNVEEVAENIYHLNRLRSSLEASYRNLESLQAEAYRGSSASFRALAESLRGRDIASLLANEVSDNARIYQTPAMESTLSTMHQQF